MMRLANAPCSWGVLEFDGAGSAPSYRRVLDEIAATGYGGTELGDWGFMPCEPNALRRELDARGLALVGAFVPVALAEGSQHGPGRDTALRTARLLSATARDTTPLIVLSDDNGRVRVRTAKAGRVTRADGLSGRAWDTFAHGAELIARAVYDETGLPTVFHPHCAGYVEAPWEIETLLARTDPARLGLCLDTGHLSFGGGDALALVDRHASRVWHVHFKDYDPQVGERSRAAGWDYFTAVGQGVFCELGRGAVPFHDVVARLTAVGYDGWIVVEQDVLPGMGTPAESAQRNRSFLRTLGL